MNTENTENIIKKLIKDLINMPKHKVAYLIAQESLVQGFIGTFKSYGVEYTESIHEEVVEAVQYYLEDSNVEREWTEDEYNNFVLFKKEDKE